MPGLSGFAVNGNARFWALSALFPSVEGILFDDVPENRPAKKAYLFNTILFLLFCLRRLTVLIFHNQKIKIPMIEKGYSLTMQSFRFPGSVNKPV
jgi:hypothetical protein